ncbi:uncharacterized protein LOC131935846 [Physella acuta]|uniref:uncharacterized protein LOC131935846 n=1 Tax=Physella acuta TaxID=109671 RepID=UPI0027DAECC7|nr:uncharacterized protein LOC131935846 [Physella acuta]
MAKVDLYDACIKCFGCSQGHLNLHKIQHEISDIVWEDQSFTVDSHRGATRKLNVNYQPHQKELYSDVETTKESEIITSVNIATGVVIGTNRKMRLSLVDAPEPVRNAIGMFLDIDPSKQYSEKSDTIKVTLGSAHKMTSPNGVGTSAQATVTVKEDRYSCNFSCTIKLSGDAICNRNGGSEQQDIAQIFSDLKEKSPKEYSHITVNTETQIQGEKPVSVSFTMSGQCQFSGQFEQTIDWN